jgi:PAS domain S-box-containing protein
MLEIVAIKKEGEEFPIELSLSAVKIKGNWNAIGIVRDITERKRAEEALRSLKEFNENVVQSIQDGLVALDRDFRITFWNSAMESISGCTVSEAQGKNIFDVLSCLTQGGVGEQLEGALEGQVTERSNIPCPTSDGKTIYWNTKHLPLRDSEGEVVGVLVVVEDVTEVLHLEQRLARLQEEIEQRKFVEIAKGILMRQLNLSEAESYQFIQKKSQDENKKMGEVAKEVIEFFGSADEREKFGKDIPE